MTNANIHKKKLTIDSWSLNTLLNLGREIFPKTEWAQCLTVDYPPVLGNFSLMLPTLKEKTNISIS